MANHSPVAHIEIEINKLLNSGKSLDLIIGEMIKNYQSTKLGREELEALSIFFLKSGYHHSLLKFLTNALERGLQIPWAQYSEALFLTTPAISEAIKSSVVRGAESQGQITDLARVVHLDHYDDRLSDMRKNRREIHKKKLEEKRQEMITTLEVLQAQGMSQEHQNLLEKFTALFPNDKDISRLKGKFEKKKSVELVDEIKAVRKPWIPIISYELLDQDSQDVLALIEDSMKSYLQKDNDPELAYDFAIAHIMWENFGTALRFSEIAIGTATQVPRKYVWLRLEILFELRRFVDVLDGLVPLETEWEDDPDATFGILYLRASCLWELSRKQQAIEIMEALCMARPNFRSATVLLSEWRGEAT